ncbi:MAG: cell division protein FtsZ [Thermoleophilia bacterium]
MTIRNERASMREGALTELFRNTEAAAHPAPAPVPAETLMAPEPPYRPSDVNNYLAVIRVVGVGGAGCNAINRMVQAGLRGVEFVAVNTDRQALASCDADVSIPVGAELTKGRGTGGDIDKGEQSIKESEEHVRRVLRGSDLVFIAAGEGGGTGTGGAPMVAKIAREMGALTVAVVTKPFGFEGARRVRAAEEGLQRLHEAADTVIVIPNDRLMNVLERGTSMVDAFRVTDDLLRQGVQGICDLITLPGLINLDFADVRTVIRDAGSAILGIGYAGGGNRAAEAAQAAISSPLLETPIDGAKGVLLGITGGPDLSLLEVSEAAEVVAAAADPEANIIFGANIDPELSGQVWVTVVAANLSGERAQPVAPPRSEPAPSRPVRPVPIVPGSVARPNVGGQPAAQVMASRIY